MPIPIDSMGNEIYIIGQPLPEATIPAYSYPLLPLFDSGYYLAQNPDVAASGMPATYHYIHYGWKEGRDPSASFDTSFYLEHNPDVAAAGINPLEHYNTYGWKEGRDPSASFDTSFYLESNPDVAAAGINPLEHFVQYGAAEGRAPSPPVVLGGIAGAVVGADAGLSEIALQQNLFDAAFYLEHNPDVAAAGINPLEHYNTYGWKEGRDPSASFDTSFYLESNPDVAAAGINPLEHFVQYGAAEGRAPSPPVVLGGIADAAAVPGQPEPDAPLSIDERRIELKDYAATQLEDVNTSKAQAFVNIIDRATDLVKDVEDPDGAMVRDLVAVLVGDDQIAVYPDQYQENRGTGEFYAGTFAGSSGFQPQFQEDAEHDSYQVQHAMAGIGIAAEYGPLIEKIVLDREEYEPDRALYKATYLIGNSLTDENYDDLPEMVANAIGDETVTVPMSDVILIA